MRRFKLHIVFLSLMLSSISVCFAQQELQNSQYMFSKYKNNPAYGGLDYSLRIDALIRSQWTGIEGQPRQQYLGVNVPAYILNGAVGGELFRSTEGALSHLQLTGSYNFVHNLPFGFLSSGLRAGLMQSTLEGARLRTSQGIYDDGNIDHSDPILSNSGVSALAPIIELGGYLYMSDAQVGVSISRLPSMNQVFDNAEIAQQIHVDVYGEYRIRWSDQLYFLQSILLKSDLNVIQTDVSTTAVINGSIFGGIGLRGYNTSSIDAIVITGGLKLGDHYRLTYSFDTGLSDIKRVNEGSHEILLNYNLNKLIGLGTTQKVEYNPRKL